MYVCVCVYVYIYIYILIADSCGCTAKTNITYKATIPQKKRKKIFLIFKKIRKPPKF